MRRRALNTDATLIVSKLPDGSRQTVKVQVLGPGTVYFSTQRSDLQQLDITGSPVNGLRLTNLNSIPDGTWTDFQDELWMRSDIGVDVDITTFATSKPSSTAQKRRGSFDAHIPSWMQL